MILYSAAARSPIRVRAAALAAGLFAAALAGGHGGHGAALGLLADVGLLAAGHARHNGAVMGGVDRAGPGRDLLLGLHGDRPRVLFPGAMPLRKRLPRMVARLRLVGALMSSTRVRPDEFDTYMC